MTHIDKCVAFQMLDEFERMCQVVEGLEKEYAGREYIEDEMIVGNADKIVFYTKEFISNFTYMNKTLLNPFLVVKLDMQSI